MLTRDQMLQCLQLAHHGGDSHSMVIERAEAYAAFVAKGGSGIMVDNIARGQTREESQQRATAEKLMSNMAQRGTPLEPNMHPDALDAPKPVEQPAPATPQSAGKTHDDCKKAFVAYLGKGGGRSAAKFVNEIMTPKFGVKNIMQVPADRLDELHADLEAA